MDTQQFLDTVLGDKGFYCTVSIKEIVGNTGDLEKKVREQFTETTKDTLANIQDFAKKDSDVYVALATFKTEKRAKTNIQQLKTLFLDIDCGEKKDYPTKTEARTALKEFYKRHQLPAPSILVDSGRGWHVYWVLDKPYPIEEWQPVAEKLKLACSQFGLHIDKQVTADAARILRVPNTLNHKTSPPLNCTVHSNNAGVTSLEDFASKLPEDLIPVLTNKEYSQEDQEDIQNLIGNTYVKRFGLLLERTMQGAGCAQIDRAVNTPNDLSYATWTHVISIAKFCDIDESLARGMENVHAISSSYHKYTEHQTNSVAKSIQAPHGCQRFEEDYPEACEGCPHKENPNFKTPISLAVQANEASEEDHIVSIPENSEAIFDDDESDRGEIKTPKYPRPYFRFKEGGIGIRTTTNGDIEEKQILGTDLYIIRKLRDRTSGTAFIFRHHTKREGIRDFMIPLQKLVGAESFKVEMAKKGVFTMQFNALKSYIGKCIEAAELMEEHTVADQFGWTHDNKSFILGDREIFSDSVKPNYPSTITEHYFPHFYKNGSLEEWKKIPRFFDKSGFEPHQYMFALSFAAPLMVFAPKIAGSIYHLKSLESGFGKSTGQFAGASVWGDPTLVVQKGDDTFASVWKVTETYKNIVVYLDELSNKDGKELSNFAYAVSGGMQRNRLRGNSGETVERYRGKPWRTLVPTSGNISILETISAEFRTHPKGEAQRVLEAETMVKLKEDAETTKEGIELNHLLENNYGWAGEIYIKKVVKHKEVAEKALLVYINRLIERTGLTAQNRYWLWQAAGALAGLSIAGRLGLHELNITNLEDWICSQLRTARNETMAMAVDIEDVIAQYLADNNRSILRIDSGNTNIEDPELEVFLAADEKPMYKFVARVESNTNTLYLLPAPFKRWCTLRKLDYGSLRRMIMDRLGGVSMKYRLSTGVKTLNLPPTYVIRLKWSEERHGDTEENPKV